METSGKPAKVPRVNFLVSMMGVFGVKNAWWHPSLVFRIQSWGLTVC